ncbi:hypothetical protein BJ912DRAFT_322691 [Pholiota molesta]|nr:hypothetical protein BJ912DRAFT_322691 [Pholiota molesta]
MAQTTSPLLRLILALRRRLLRILKPQCVERALTGILRRLAVLWRLFRSKLYFLPKRIDKPPKDELTTPKDHVEGASSDQKPYTIIRHGDTISLDEASFSLSYPFSSNGIRNTSRSSVIRLGDPESRSHSRSSQHPESNYVPSIRGPGSVYDLPLNPTPIPSGTFSRNPQRQMSSSLQDLHIPGYPIANSSRQEQYTPKPDSPNSEVGIEVTSPTSLENENEPVIRDPCDPGRDQRTSNSSNQHGDYSTRPSPPPSINVEPMSHHHIQKRVLVSPKPLGRHRISLQILYLSAQFIRMEPMIKTTTFSL